MSGITVKPLLDFSGLKVIKRNKNRPGNSHRLNKGRINKYYAKNTDLNHRHKASIPCTRKCPQFKR